LESKKQCKKIRQILDEVDAGTSDYALSVIVPHIESIICEKMLPLVTLSEGTTLIDNENIDGMAGDKVL